MEQIWNGGSYDKKINAQGATNRLKTKATSHSARQQNHTKMNYSLRETWWLVTIEADATRNLSRTDGWIIQQVAASRDQCRYHYQVGSCYRTRFVRLESGPGGMYIKNGGGNKNSTGKYKTWLLSWQWTLELIFKLLGIAWDMWQHRNKALHKMSSTWPRILEVEINKKVMELYGLGSSMFVSSSQHPPETPTIRSTAATKCL